MIYFILLLSVAFTWLLLSWLYATHRSHVSDRRRYCAECGTRLRDCERREGRCSLCESRDYQGMPPVGNDDCFAPPVNRPS